MTSIIGVRCWRKARKKPVVILFREPLCNDKGPSGMPGEYIATLEGKLFAECGRDYVIQGVKGELYPISKEIFEQTYEVIEE